LKSERNRSEALKLLNQGFLFCAPGRAVLSRNEKTSILDYRDFLGLLVLSRVHKTENLDSAASVLQIDSSHFSKMVLACRSRYNQ